MKSAYYLCLVAQFALHVHFLMCAYVSEKESLEVIHHLILNFGEVVTVLDMSSKTTLLITPQNGTVTDVSTDEQLSVMLP